MKDASPAQLWCAGVLAVGWTVSAELLGSLGSASPLPVVPGWTLPVGLLILAVLLVPAAFLCHHLYRRFPRGGDAILLVAGLAIFLGTWWITGGWRPLAVPLAAVASVLILGGWTMTIRRDRSAGNFLWILAVFLLASSSDPLQVAHRPDTVFRQNPTLAFLALTGATGLVLVAGETLTGYVERRVRPPRPPLTAITGGVLLVAAIAWWGMLPGGASGSSFRGTLPDVQAPPVQSLPNIVVISLDTLRLDPVPPLSKRGVRTPNLNALHRDSVTFPRMVSTSSWTLPAHASLFSGRLPFEHGAVIEANSRIYRNRPLYTQILRELGYRTAAFTDGVLVAEKFGFGRGFERYWEHPLAVEQYTPGILEWASLPSRYLLDADFRIELHDRRSAGKWDPGPLRFFDRNLRRARSWVRRVRSDHPFFLFLHTYRVHDWNRYYPGSVRRLRREHPRLARALHPPNPSSPEPRKPDPEEPVETFQERLERMDPEARKQLTHRLDAFGETRARFLKKALGRGDPFLLHRFRELDPRKLARLRSLSDTELRNLSKIPLTRLRAQRTLYDYEVEAVDRALGSFLTFLKRRDLYDASIIVLLSDHGEGFLLDSSALSHGHGQLDEVLLRVPLWIKLPQNRRHTHRYEPMLQITDVFPMLFEYLDIHTDPPLAPRAGPVRSALADPDVPGRTVVRGSIKSTQGRNPRFFVRDGRYKYLRDLGLGKNRFFRVGDTEASQSPIPSDRVDPPARHRLKQHMRRLVARWRSGPNPYRLNNIELTPQLRRQLKGMGYLD